MWKLAKIYDGCLRIVSYKCLHKAPIKKVECCKVIWRNLIIQMQDLHIRNDLFKCHGLVIEQENGSCGV